jgi:hypothetical protein
LCQRVFQRANVDGRRRTIFHRADGYKYQKVGLSPALRGGVYGPKISMMALVVGLVSIALVWLIVIYGSIHLNKNVQ